MSTEKSGAPGDWAGLTGRVVIVTGGGTGIGKVYCERLAGAGVRTVVADINGDGARAVADAIAGRGGEALAVAADIADEVSVAALVQAAAERFGRIDGLVNNAALMSQLARRPWYEIDVAEWDRVMAVNLRGMFLCCRAVYPYMKRQGGGRIINISSGRVWDGTPGRLHYSASKAGVIGLTRSLAREVGDDGIAVNAITPGFTASETQLANSSPEHVRRMERLAQNKCFKRLQTPEDLVGTVMFLLSDASAHITGQAINVDGGMVMH